MAVQDDAGQTRSRGAALPAFVYDPVIRGYIFQALMAILIVWGAYDIISNTIANLQRANIASGFGFLENRAGFEVSQSLIDYSSDSSYGDAYLVGLLNTLLIAVLGIFFATIVGFVMGIARLSPNWLLRKVATVYVEIFRNVPVLLQLLFWYKAVLALLPSPKQGIEFSWLGANLSNRGLIVPRFVPEEGFSVVTIAFVIAIVATFLVARWAKARQMATGQPFHTFWVGLAIIIGLPLLAFLVMGLPMSIETPVLKGFNFQGGIALKPEFLALLLGLTIYTSTYIAEIVRAGIRAVSWGQSEAAFALGLRPGLTTRLVIIPQAMRVIIPPLTSQYLNLTKNSSLAVAIGYPDLVSVFSGTVLNQTGQAVEVIIITMATYLVFSLATATFMNWFNSRMRLVER
ncbi:putative glutamine ABC transporter permease protein GlnM [Hartmannibacter diazotrophicus]|uniref:Putative glutamine ABC transporter permease protein GlnM n=1 Tax=Hartmannibacter diazotrophicus TaxID=1482074 RepID=A0A2C9D586_9HYPH|nr:amino acid ABC transporter permease [Hartmannibacter diazotrophicus]SON55339.1 putative glutamine ABC transporter permease protein GlnM [Hartmannibacter diazotrophicus]